MLLLFFGPHILRLKLRYYKAIMSFPSGRVYLGGNDRHHQCTGKKDKFSEEYIFQEFIRISKCLNTLNTYFRLIRLDFYASNSVTQRSCLLQKLVAYNVVVSHAYLDATSGNSNTDLASASDGLNVFSPRTSPFLETSVCLTI